MHYNNFNVYYKKHIKNSSAKEKLLCKYICEKEYMWCNEDTLYSIKPRKSNDELMKIYCDIYKDPSYNFDLQPHVYELANLAYFRLRRLGEDQTIAFQSDSQDFNASLDCLNYLGKTNPNLRIWYSLLEKFNGIEYILLQYNSKGRLGGFHTTTICQTYELFNNNLFFWLLNSNSLNKKERESFGLLSKQRYITDNNIGYNLDVEIKSLGIKRYYRDGLLRILAFILNLGNLDFIMQDKTVKIKNPNLIGILSEILLLDPDMLATNLLMKNTSIGGEKCTIFYTRKQADEHLIRFSQYLFGLVVDYIILKVNINNSLEEEFNSIGLLNLSQIEVGVEMNDFCRLLFLEKYNNVIETSTNFNNINYINNETNCYLDPLVRFIDINTDYQLSNKNKKINREFESICDYYKNESRLEFNINTSHVKDQIMFINGEISTKFMINHYEFDINQLVIENKLDYQISLSMIELLMDSDFEFCNDLFKSEKVNLTRQIKSNYSRPGSVIPSRPGSKRFTTFNAFDIKTNIGVQLGTFNEIYSSILDTYLFKVINFDPDSLDRIINNTKNSFVVNFDKEEFHIRYISNVVEATENGIINYMNKLGLINNNYLIDELIYLDWYAFFFLENILRKKTNLTPELEYQVPEPLYPGEYLFDQSTDLKEIKMKELIKAWATPELTKEETPSISDDTCAITVDQANDVSEKDSHTTLVRNYTPNRISYHDPPKSTSRKLWLGYVYLATFLLPDSIIKYLVNKRKDLDVNKRILAYREKLALFLLILLSWVFILFINILLPYLLCPSVNLITMDELQTHALNNPNKPKGIWTSLRGSVYNLDKLSLNDHANGISSASKDNLEKLSGLDITYMFPISPSVACPSIDVQMEGVLTINYTDVTLKAEKIDQTPIVFVHDFGNPLSQYQGLYEESPHLGNENWYSQNVLANIKHIKRGELVYSKNDLLELRNDNQYIVKINDDVYDFESYFYSLLYNPQINFLNQKLVALIAEFGDKNYDMSYKFNNLKLSKSELSCIKNLFYRGKIDPRLSVKCIISNYLLYWSAWAILIIIFLKFLASLQFTLATKPSKILDKYAIIQIPCYTESESSIRKSINSVIKTDYPNQQKVLFLVVDGLVMGHGNTKSTSDIILDIFKPSNQYTSKPLYYNSLNDNKMLELNRAKVYSGIYEHQDQEIKYIIVIKVGNQVEVLKPGNRGKRDSQCLVFNFFNKVFKQFKDSDILMNPLELELYSHFTNHLLVNPQLFEFIILVDADTELMTSSISQLLSTMIYDNKVLGVCGETIIQNEHESWATMIQVYEYFVSHFLHKAFESLFGSVTCLPGCFSAYRLRSSIPAEYLEYKNIDWSILKDKITPYLISDEIIKEYSRLDVSSLHSKNLLSLGEDRYLTSLMLKHFTQGKLKFNPEAQCKTQAPNTFKMLLSQRRRWINSTIHNLIELIKLDSLCGCGWIFNMRLIVFIDLIGTILMPAMIIYLIYLFTYITYSGIYTEEDKPRQQYGLNTLSITTLLLLGLIYGTQIIMFTLKLRFKYIGWLLLYTIFVPFFHFFLPIYSFWLMDDFSWGSTRQISRQNEINDLDKSDDIYSVKDIPRMTWLQFINSDLYSPIFDDPINKAWDSGDQFIYSDLTLNQSNLVAFESPHSDLSQMNLYNGEIQIPESAINPFYNDQNLDISASNLYFTDDAYIPHPQNHPHFRNTIGYHYSSPNLATQSTHNLNRNTQSFSNFYPNYGAVRKSFY